MNDLSTNLNKVLVEAYNVILKVEEEMIQSTNRIDLSMSEMHMIESVGKFSDATISKIAGDLRITLPSVTISINKLIKKGYVEKVKSNVDARVVNVKLTAEGEKINNMHAYFHKKMTDAVIKEMSDEEQEALFKGVVKLLNFFDRELKNIDKNK